MAVKFVETLPSADYLAVGVNPRGLVPFFENDRGAHEFLFHKLFAQGAWQDFGQAPAQAAIQLSYVLEQGQLNLAINEAKLKGQDGKSVSAVVFLGISIIPFVERWGLNGSRTSKNEFSFGNLPSPRFSNSSMNAFWTQPINHRLMRISPSPPPQRMRWCFKFRSMKRDDLRGQ